MNNKGSIENIAQLARNVQLANCDQESWVKSRIRTAIRMATAVTQEMKVGADGPALECALEGIVNGTAVEVIRSLGMEPEFVNLRRP